MAGTTNAHIQLGGGGVYSTEHGQILDGNAMRLAEVLHDYNHYFSLEYIPSKDQEFGDRPYRIVDSTPGMRQNVVRYVTHAEMLNPEKVIADIWRGDLRKHSPHAIISDMEFEEEAARVLKLKEQEEQAAEMEDRIVFNLTGGRDHKHYLRSGGQTISR